MALAAHEKTDLLRDHLAASGLRTLVETGLYEGRGSGMDLLPQLDRYIVIDIQPGNVEIAARTPGVEAVLGDSGTVLPDILATLDGPAVFWLDAHFVAAYDGNETLDRHGVPLLPELKAIRAWRHGLDSTVLIDDMRLIGDYGWPGRVELDALTDGWDAAEAHDILRLTPAR